ncbi:MAG TPA: TIGR02757 family protein [Chitinophagaceae bacterium]|nr:TIGR02757 family protein [Chitinophagaceae bacterium]
MMPRHLKDFLDKKVREYNRPEFIKDDPVSVPHSFTKKQDIEIAGFFAAVFAWGNRTTIITKSKELMRRMDNAPFDFIRNPTRKDLENLRGFKHRTFNHDDLYYFLEVLHRHYSDHDTLEKAFLPPSEMNQAAGGELTLIHFKKYFFSLEHLKRTEKHISSPLQKSTCKRLNMFLRWMVRNDNQGVDFGLWKHILPSQLICPIDVHVARVAKKLGLLKRKQIDWFAALELTESLRKLDNSDPVKYDFALFNLGVIEKY